MMYDGYLLGKLETFFCSTVPEQCLKKTIMRLPIFVHATFAADLDDNNRKSLCVEYAGEFLQVNLSEGAKTKGKAFATLIKDNSLYLCLKKEREA